MVSVRTLSLLLLPSAALASFNLLDLAEGDQIPQNGNKPACLAAYNATIECDSEILTNNYSQDNLPPEKWLDDICTSTCLNSLRKWVRGGDGCEGKEYLDYFGIFDDPDFFGTGYNATIADVQQYWVTSTFHYRCLTNLNPIPNQSKYCILQNTTTEASYSPAVFDISKPDTFCKENSCGTQSAYLWAPINVTYKYDLANIDSTRNSDEEPPMISLEEACPDIDTSKFPRREADITQADLESGTVDPDTPTSNTDGSDGAGNNGTGSGSSTGNSTTEQDKPNAAAGTVLEKTILFSAVLAVAGYMFL